MTEWGWTPERNLGIWRHGAGWFRPVAAAVPFAVVGVLLLMLFFVGGTLSSSRGVLFDLPEGDFADVHETGLVALVMPVSHETLVFFDDSRYQVGDAGSMRGLSENLSSRVEHTENKTLLVLADRRVSSGSLLSLVSLARRCGVTKVLVAGKNSGEAE